jgi:GGDEF domain-containing protein
MISLKRYLNANGEETLLLRQVVALLISKIGSSAVRCDLAEFEAFTTNIKRISQALAPDLTPENLMIQAEAAVQDLTAYNTRIARLLDSQRSDVTHILGMLQDTVVNIAGENIRSAKRLQEITAELEKSGLVTDLRVLKGRLTECLTGLREEMLQQKAEAAITIENLQVTIERSRGSVVVATAASNSGPPERGRSSILAAAANRPGQADHDRESVVATAGNSPAPVAILICRDAALAAMKTAINGGTRHYAVVMVVNRIQMINARFGQKIGDHMLAGFKEHMTKQLSGSDKLFPWTGPAFVAILERPESLESVRLQMKRLLDAKIEISYSGDGRSVLIPISAVWLTLPLTSSADADKQIQTFIASQSTRG